MNGKMLKKFCAALSVAALSVSLLWVGAAAEAQPCKSCAEGTFKGFTQTKEYQKVNESQCAPYFECNNGHKQLRFNPDGTFMDLKDHVPSTNATCEARAVCGDCGSEYGAPLGHKVVVDPAVAPTCTKTGLTEGKHCEVCKAVLTAQQTLPVVHQFDNGVITRPTCSKEGYTTYTCTLCGYKEARNKVPTLSHWYDVWEPAGKGQNSAPCKREGCDHVKTTACANWDFKLVCDGAEKAEAFYICPVCGQMSDGGRLELVKDAKVKAISGGIPEGDLLLRVGEMENGEKVMCIGFEFDARLVYATGYTRFTVPAQLLEGCRLMLVDADGGETEVEVETVGEDASFTLSFHGDAQGIRKPVRMLHLVPIGE